MRTLIVDDHLLFSAGLRLLLQATGSLGEVDCAASRTQALQQAARIPYDPKSGSCSPLIGR
jgi:DNA-binding NarL/FixJ family response regulator